MVLNVLLFVTFVLFEVHFLCTVAWSLQQNDVGEAPIADRIVSRCSCLRPLRSRAFRCLKDVRFDGGCIYFESLDEFERSFLAQILGEALSRLLMEFPEVDRLGGDEFVRLLNTAAVAMEQSKREQVTEAEKGLCNILKKFFQGRLDLSSLLDRVEFEITRQVNSVGLSMQDSEIGNVVLSAEADEEMLAAEQNRLRDAVVRQLRGEDGIVGNVQDLYCNGLILMFSMDQYRQCITGELPLSVDDHVIQLQKLCGHQARSPAITGAEDPETKNSASQVVKVLVSVGTQTLPTANAENPAVLAEPTTNAENPAVLAEPTTNAENPAVLAEPRPVSTQPIPSEPPPLCPVSVQHSAIWAWKIDAEVQTQPFETNALAINDRKARLLASSASSHTSWQEVASSPRMQSDASIRENLRFREAL
eukprot:gnl/TRDRNA2_/TRDRNA2_109388_c1_seq1.p1 gnl/TRDRNA2_/TRDRNA2_109388_c1~~gnl/TRDRNA2_/TRDRNA2_109388_c1_seq1.p1  ORF type:complete len:450 (-),score=45.68 gnl/TRDRNA2_/TRDRNA2_109388_c1_seq1:71-1327(-)